MDLYPGSKRSVEEVKEILKVGQLYLAIPKRKYSSFGKRFLHWI